MIRIFNAPEFNAHHLLPPALGLLCLLGVQSLGASSEAATFQSWQPHEEWRIGEGVVAPWAEPGTLSLLNPELEGQVIRFDGDQLVGPHPLGCTDAYYEFVVSPAEGLFQGGLPAPSDVAASDLGISELPLLTWRVNCSTGSFDYHFISASQLVLGLDQVVWSLHLAQQDTSPESVTLGLLRDHMTHDMAFTEETILRKDNYLTRGLKRAIADYFALPAPANEAPVINGDPFTDSQEYPSGFVLGEALMVNSEAIVPVLFQDFDRQKRVEMVLHREGSRWLIDDLRFPDGMTLRDLLKADANSNY